MYRLRPNRGKVAPAGRRVVAQAGGVDASWTKAKLMRLKKGDLESAGKELGLRVQGTKGQMADKILGHFGNVDPRASQPRGLATSQSTTIRNPAPITVQRPMPPVATKTAVKPAADKPAPSKLPPAPKAAAAAPAKPAVKSAAKTVESHPVDTAAKAAPVAVKSASATSKPAASKPPAVTKSQVETPKPDPMLTKRVAELESQLVTRTGELDKLRADGKKTMEGLQTQHAALEAELKTTTARAAELAGSADALDESKAQLSALQREQSELRTALGDAKRLVELRDRELETLNATLAEVRKAQAAAEEGHERERLAVLAMSAQLASAREAESVASHPVDVAADEGPAVVAAGGDRQARVYGAAFPALAVCSAGSKAFDTYAGVRDALVEGRKQRIAADAVTVSVLAVLFAAVSM